METINLLIQSAKKHPTFASVIIAALVAWIIHRFEIWHARGSLLNAIESEFNEAHQYWLRTDWSKDREKELRENKDFLRQIVFKIETTAISQGINSGGNLFVNSELIKKIVAYKQAISSLNQLIDLYNGFVTNVELWDKAAPSEAVDRAQNLYVTIHIGGIGGYNDNGARKAYLDIRTEIDKEKNSKIIPIIWLVTGINLFKLKEFFCKYL